MALVQKSAFALTVLLAVAAAIECGLITVPLPFPANGKFIHTASPASLPPRGNATFKPTNSALTAVTRPFEGVKGVEAIAVAPDGSLTLIDTYGKVFRAAATSAGDYALDPPTPIATLGTGRNLGTMYDKQGNLYVCNSPFGLMRVEHLGQPEKQRIELVASRTGSATGSDAGSPILFADDLDIGSDGTVYFSDATDIPAFRKADGSWDGEISAVLALTQGKPAGRLLAYHPSNRTTRVLADGFLFTNGVALAADESFVAVVDLVQQRVMRVWLKGPKAGTQDVLVDHLPALPDNLSRAPDGNFWIAFVSASPRVLQLSGPMFMRAVMAHLPKALRPKPEPIGLVMKVSPEGQVLEILSDPTGATVSSVTHAVEHDGRLFLGNLHGNVGVLKLDAAART